MRGYEASTYGDRWADVYDEWYDDPVEVEETVAFLADLAGDPHEGAPSSRPIVELGIGTGRLALPLAARGYDVRGIDASAAMVAKLRAKPGGEALAVTVGDMAAFAIPARDDGDGDEDALTCRGVFVASNTFFGLSTDEDQARCVGAIAAALEPGGWFVVAAFVPADHLADGAGSTVGVRSLDADRLVLSADRHDPADQTISGQFVDISSAGIVLRPFHLRYLYPDQLDALAAAAGLRLDRRVSSWRGDPFDDTSTAHVSVYRRT